MDREEDCEGPPAFMEEYIKPKQSKIDELNKTAEACLVLIRKEIGEYKQMETVKEKLAKQINQTTLCELYIELDADRYGSISYEHFSNLLGSNSQNSFTYDQWRKLLTRLCGYHTTADRNREHMLFVDMFDLVFPLIYLGDIDVGGSTLNQQDPNFASLLDRMRSHWDVHHKFTKNTNTSVGESEYMTNFKQTIGTGSQNLHNTFGIMELKYEDEGEIMITDAKEGIFRQLDPIFQGQLAGSLREKVKTERDENLDNYEQNYNSESNKKKLRKQGGLNRLPGQESVQGTAANYTSNQSSTKSDKINCFWNLLPPKNQETSNPISGQLSPKYNSNSLTFNRDHEPHRLSLYDYEELVACLTFLKGRNIKPRARMLLEVLACEGNLN